jgi:hypothetical protein
MLNDRVNLLISGLPVVSVRYQEGIIIEPPGAKIKNVAAKADGNN